MANRILLTAEEIERRLVTLPVDTVAELAQSTELDPFEGPAYQDLQARAHASGILTLDEANTIYHALGGEAARWSIPADDNANLALRLAVTMTLGELATAELAARKPVTA